MSSITVNIKTLQQKDYPLEVTENTTIRELKDTATNTLNLGVATTCVFKGAPLKNDTATLGSLGIKAGDNIITVFKKKPAAAPAAAAPAAAPASTTTSTPAAAAAPAAAPASADTPAANAPAAAEPAAPVEWSCPSCTYINIAARSVCEMCETPNPARPRLVNARAAASQMMSDADTDGMDEATRLAIQGVLESDIGEGDEHDALAIDLDEMLERAAGDENTRRSLARELGVDENSTVEQLRQAAMDQAHEEEAMGGEGISAQGLLSMLSQDPQAQAQLASALGAAGGNMSNEQMEAMLMALLQGGGGEMFGEEEDDMDMDDDMGADPW